MALQIDQLNLNGRYRIEAVIGQGAYTVVYRATHITTRQVRALKVAAAEIPGVPAAVIDEYRTRFTAGAQYGIRIDDPHVVQSYDFGQDGDKLILAMACAYGGNLADRLWKLRLGGRLMSIDDCVTIALDVADGMATVHIQDVVYGNLKPSNVLFDADGTARLADLGLAQLPGGLSMHSQVNRAGLAHPGTPAYMSPEQRSTTDYLTPPSDIYALGLLLFETLTGRVYRNVRPGTRTQLLRSNVPIWLDDLAVRMLAEQPGDRPWDGFEIANLLRHKRSEDSAPRLEPALSWEPIEPPLIALDQGVQSTASIPTTMQDALTDANPGESHEPPLGWAPLDHETTDSPAHF